jgi:glycosyltransferase involved in cell wall biosynthesis
VTANTGIKRKRILVLTSTFPRWPGDREPPFVFELSKRLAEKFEVIVLAPHARGAKLAERMGAVEVHRFRYFFANRQTLTYDGGVLANLKKNPLNYLLIPFFVFSELFSLIRLLRRTEVDAIHAHWVIPQGFVAVAAGIFVNPKPPILCTSHGGDLFGLSGKLLTWIKRRVIREVSKLTVVSGAMQEYASALSKRPDVEVIPMGVDLVQGFAPAPIAREPYELLFAGRLVEKKGVRYIILAMPKILECCPNARLLIAGDGPERAGLEQLAISTGVAPYISFLGRMDNAELPNLYRRASIFIGPSVVAQGGDQEGLGLVFVEALGCECAVVASDLPAIKDVVIDGVTGLICKQKDSEDLAGKVVALLESPDLRKSLGQAGRQHVLNHFDWQMTAGRYSRLIEELTS